MTTTRKVTAFSAIGGIFLALASMAVPLRAKCPRNFVGVRGKIQCTFKSDYKVLLTLIYSEHQPEGYGEETALDLHDGTFKGEIAFDTFTSYNPVTGEHNCSREPKRVVVRLVSADGSQWDRKELKITETFRYDEEKGYVLQSDLILHGWCPGGR